MNGQDFIRITHEAFEPFLSKLGFAMDEPSISGRYYRVSFTAPQSAVSVSYEPGDDALFVMVFGRKNGQLSDIDNRKETPRLSDLNRRYMTTVTQAERVANDKAFESVMVNDNEERQLLKAAKELRLVLPKHLCSPDGLRT
jgi:hypothetical protein